MTSTLAAATVSDPSPRRTLRSVGAVFAGIAVNFIFASGIDAVLHATGVFPPLDAPPMSDVLFALALSYRLVIGVAGAALTAWLAPRAPMKHALILGGIGTVLSILGAVAMWMATAGAAWYPVVLAASALPCSWLGGRLLNRAARP